jgi:hypothetical protein
MLSPYALPHLRFFPEAEIEAGFFFFFFTFQPHAGPSGDAGTMFNSLHFSYFDSTLIKRIIKSIKNEKAHLL